MAIAESVFSFRSLRPLKPITATTSERAPARLAYGQGGEAAPACSRCQFRAERCEIVLTDPGQFDILVFDVLRDGVMVGRITQKTVDLDEHGPSRLSQGYSRPGKDLTRVP